MTSKTRVFAGAAIAAMLLASPLIAQDIDFGDDSSSFANDGQCDDPRFSGDGAAIVNSPADTGRDATDCQAAHEAGTVTFQDDDGAGTPAPAEENAPQPDGSGDQIDFGDDSGEYANDGECDDPRFGGILQSHRMTDATDCRTALEAGDVTYLGEGADEDGTPVPEITAPETAVIDFGDDSSEYANDGQCSDPRFGAAFPTDVYSDASDCEAAYQAGDVTYRAERDVTVGEIDFGDDSGLYANDLECDDPRFGAHTEFTDHIRADATDCRSAFEAGDIVYFGEVEETEETDAPSADTGEIDFGDDSGEYALDEECDDPRFAGAGASVGFDTHLYADATDCRQALEAGTVRFGEDVSSTEPDGDSPGFTINFGDDSGQYPNDNECDDPRFQGLGAAMELYDANLLRDATDCRTAYESGTVTYTR